MSWSGDTTGEKGDWKTISQSPRQDKSSPKVLPRRSLVLQQKSNDISPFKITADDAVSAFQSSIKSITTAQGSVSHLAASMLSFASSDKASLLGLGPSTHILENSSHSPTVFATIENPDTSLGLLGKTSGSASLQYKLSRIESEGSIKAHAAIERIKGASALALGKNASAISHLYRAEHLSHAIDSQTRSDPARLGTLPSPPLDQSERDISPSPPSVFTALNKTSPSTFPDDGQSVRGRRELRSPNTSGTVISLHDRSTMHGRHQVKNESNALAGTTSESDQPVHPEGNRARNADHDAHVESLLARYASPSRYALSKSPSRTRLDETIYRPLSVPLEGRSGSVSRNLSTSDMKRIPLVSPSQLTAKDSELSYSRSRAKNRSPGASTSSIHASLARHSSFEHQSVLESLLKPMNPFQRAAFERSAAKVEREAQEIVQSTAWRHLQANPEQQKRRNPSLVTPHRSNSISGASTNMIDLHRSQDKEPNAPATSYDVPSRGRGPVEGSVRLDITSELARTSTRSLSARRLPKDRLRPGAEPLRAPWPSVPASAGPAHSRTIAAAPTAIPSAPPDPIRNASKNDSEVKSQTEDWKGLYGKDLQQKAMEETYRLPYDTREMYDARFQSLQIAQPLPTPPSIPSQSRTRVISPALRLEGVQVHHIKNLSKEPTVSTSDIFHETKVNQAIAATLRAAENLEKKEINEMTEGTSSPRATVDKPPRALSRSPTRQRSASLSSRPYPGLSRLNPQELRTQSQLLNKYREDPYGKDNTAEPESVIDRKRNNPAKKDSLLEHGVSVRKTALQIDSEESIVRTLEAKVTDKKHAYVQFLRARDSSFRAKNEPPTHSTSKSERKEDDDSSLSLPKHDQNINFGTTVFNDSLDSLFAQGDVIHNTAPSFSSFPSGYPTQGRGNYSSSPSHRSPSLDTSKFETDLSFRNDSTISAQRQLSLSTRPYIPLQVDILPLDNMECLTPTSALNVSLEVSERAVDALLAFVQGPPAQGKYITEHEIQQNGYEHSRKVADWCAQQGILPPSAVNSHLRWDAEDPFYLHPDPASMDPLATDSRHRSRSVTRSHSRTRYHTSHSPRSSNRSLSNSIGRDRRSPSLVTYFPYQSPNALTKTQRVTADPGKEVWRLSKPRHYSPFRKQDSFEVVGASLSPEMSEPWGNPAQPILGDELELFKREAPIMFPEELVSAKVELRDIHIAANNALSPLFGRMKRSTYDALPAGMFLESYNAGRELNVQYPNDFRDEGEAIGVERSTYPLQRLDFSAEFTSDTLSTENFREQNPLPNLTTNTMEESTTFVQSSVPIVRGNPGEKHPNWEPLQSETYSTSPVAHPDPQIPFSDQAHNENSSTPFVKEVGHNSSAHAEKEKSVADVGYAAQAGGSAQFAETAESVESILLRNNVPVFSQQTGGVSEVPLSNSGASRKEASQAALSIDTWGVDEGPNNYAHDTGLVYMLDHQSRARISPFLSAEPTGKEKVTPLSLPPSRPALIAPSFSATSHILGSADLPAHKFGKEETKDSPPLLDVAKINQVPLPHPPPSLSEPRRRVPRTGESKENKVTTLAFEGTKKSTAFDPDLDLNSPNSISLQASSRTSKTGANGEESDRNRESTNRKSIDEESDGDILILVDDSVPKMDHTVVGSETISRKELAASGGSGSITSEVDDWSSDSVSSEYPPDYEDQLEVSQVTDIAARSGQDSYDFDTWSDES